MYKTNSTNGTSSAALSKSFAQMQYGLFDEDDNVHNQDALIIEQVFAHYHNTLKMMPELIGEVMKRKVDPDYIDLFQIGFSDRSLGVELQSPRCLVGSRNRGHLQRLGILKETGHEFFRGALVVPYRNVDGSIVGAYGRRTRHQRRSPAYHLYWNAQQVPLFNASDHQLPSTLVLGKSAMDSLTLLTAGIDNVVATMGTKGFNDVQLSRLEKDGVKRVYIAFDNTPSANHHALLVAQALDSVGIQCYRVKLPTGHDVNSFALGQADVGKAFNRLVKEAEPFMHRYSELLPKADHWLDLLETLDDCVQFYLDESRYSGMSFRTLQSNSRHLSRFQEYCRAMGVERVGDLTSPVLESYCQYLTCEKNTFTGNVISTTTQSERMEAVTRMLSRLHYYGVIPEPVSLGAQNYNGVIH